MTKAYTFGIERIWKFMGYITDTEDIQAASFLGVTSLTR